MNFPRYSKYKDSGVAWLGEVPAHWEVGQVRRYFSVELGKMLDASKQDGSGIRKPYLRAANIFWDAIDVTDVNEMEFSPSQMLRYRLQYGDLLVTEGGATVGRSAIWQGEMDECFYQNSLNRVRPLKSSQLPSRYLLYWIQFATQIGYVELVSDKATFGHLTNEKLKAFPLLRPATFQEATDIVDFLDCENAKIDDLVTEQQRLIELLQEKRQAVIAHAVTKGLNADAPMKPSGVEWLGEVPAHWEIKKLKYLGKAIIGLTYDPSDVVNEGEGILVLRSSNVQDRKIVFDDNVFVSKQIPEDLITKQGDILICSRNGSRALIGKNAVIDDHAAGTTFGAFMTIFRSPNNSYLSCVFNSTLFQYQSSSYITSTVNQLTIGVLNNFEVPYPPRVEREQIVSFIREEESKLNTLINEAQKAIDLLQERRQALISAAVTGQIDVRSLTNVSSG